MLHAAPDRCVCALTCNVSSGLGAAYGTAKSGVGVANMGVLHPDVVMKSIIPVVMAGVLGIYGLIVAVLLASGSKPLPPPTLVFSPDVLDRTVMNQ